jgi:hypothetical protein
MVWDRWELGVRRESFEGLSRYMCKGRHIDIKGAPLHVLFVEIS